MLAMSLSALQVIAIGSVLTTCVLKQQLSSAWGWVVPIFFTFFVVYNGYRMFIYERFLNPISGLPGPKVHPF
jgi:hypothetical protein